MTKIKDLMSDKELSEHLPFDDDDLVRFLWEIREEKNIFGMKRTTMMRFFSTLAKTQAEQ